jgi:hypothetical protein
MWPVRPSYKAMDGRISSALAQGGGAWIKEIKSHNKTRADSGSHIHVGDGATTELDKEIPAHLFLSRHLTTIDQPNAGYT